MKTEQLERWHQIYNDSYFSGYDPAQAVEIADFRYPKPSRLIKKLSFSIMLVSFIGAMLLTSVHMFTAIHNQNLKNAELRERILKRNMTLALDQTTYQSYYQSKISSHSNCMTFKNNIIQDNQPCTTNTVIAGVSGLSP